MSTLWNLLPGWDHAYLFLVYIIIFCPLELLLPARRQRFFRPGWITDLLHFTFTAIFISLGLTAVIGGSILLGALVTPDVVRQWLGSQPVWLQIIIGTVLADLFFYFGHRMQHEVPWLWNFHAVHHSSKQLDWLAAFRVHPVDQIFEKGTSLIPVFALGFSEPAIIAMAIIYQWQSLFIHSNVGIDFRWLKWLVATPQFHHWHHADDAAGYNKNFSGQLPLWDIVFRTAHLPASMPQSYGIKEAVSGNYLMQLIHPFARLAVRMSQRTRRSTGPVPPPAQR